MLVWTTVESTLSHRLGTHLVGPTDERRVIGSTLQIEAAENCLNTIESQTKRSG
jgi:hypothetical protein